MSCDFNKSRSTLAELLKRPIPKSAANARAADMAALNAGELTEYELIGFYNTAYGTAPIEEEETSEEEILPEANEEVLSEDADSEEVTEESSEN